MTATGAVLLLLAAALFLAAPARAAAPAKPTGFTATGGSYQVVLAWTDPSDPTILRWQYRYKTWSVTSGTGAFGSWTDWTDMSGATATTTSHTVTGLANGNHEITTGVYGKHVFELRAVNVDGNGAASDEKTATMAPAMLEWGTLAVTVGSSPSVRLEWLDPGDGTIDKWEYRQRVGTAAFGSWTDYTPTQYGGWKRYNLTGLEAKTYTFQIRAVNESGNGDTSPTRHVSLATGGICSRTQQVQDDIIATLAARGKTRTCAHVTGADLYGLYGSIDLSNESIAALKNGDFDGLGKLLGITLDDNDLTALPSDVFDGLNVALSIQDNDLASLPAGIFDDMSMGSLKLHNNKLTSLRADVFKQQPGLRTLYLDGNELSWLPSTVFSGQSKVHILSLANNKLSSLPSGVFDGLSINRLLDLRGNALTSLPAGIFSKVRIYKPSSQSYDATLRLSGNELSSLPAGVFDGLSELENLWLQGNKLTSLPKDVFKDLSALTHLDLGSNKLSSLRADVFSGVSNVDFIKLDNNPNLKSLPQTVFHGLPKLTRLNLPSLNCKPDIPSTVTILIPSDIRNKAVCAPRDQQAPTVTGRHEQLDVTWKAAIPGGARITSHDLQYRAGTAGAWTTVSVPHTDTAKIAASISGLVNGASYEVRVRAVSPDGVGPWSTVVTGKPVSGSHLVLSESSVTVPENGTATYTVQLSLAPTDDVTVTVARTSGDTDLTVDTDSNTAGNQDTLTFTATNWSTAQTVTVSAAQDTDAVSGTAVITHTAASDDDDYEGVTATLSAAEADNGASELVIAASVTVPEGGTKGYTVALSRQPSANVTVSVARKSGNDQDTNLTVSAGSPLTFTTQNWNTAQTVTLAAAEDDDHAEGSAVFVHTASGGDFAGISKELTATESDNDTAGLVLAPTGVTVPEGGEASYKVKLATKPSGSVQVTVARKTSGTQDSDLSVKTGALLGFNASNWNTTQDVILQAAQDTDALNGQAVFVAIANGADYAGATKELTATEADDDVQIVLSKTRVTVPEGSTATYTVKLKGQPTANVTVSVSRSAGDSNISVSPSSLTFTTTNYGTAKTVTLSAAQDTDENDGEATITHSATGGQYGGKTAALTAVENDDDGWLTLSSSAVTVPESKTATYTIKLKSQPAANVTVSVSRSAGDNSISVSGTSSFTFTTQNWSTAQTVTLAAANDSDGADGTATIRHRATIGGTQRTANLTATEADDDRRFSGLAQGVSVSEGGTATFKMGLNIAPPGGGTVTITVTKKTGGDPSLTVDTDPNTAGNQNTFTLTKVYNTTDPQAHGEVTISAAHDEDAYGGTEDSAFTFTASGGGFDGTSKPLNVTVSDDDAIGLAPAPGITAVKSGSNLVAGDWVWVPEGGTTVVPLRLVSRPKGNVTVTASVQYQTQYPEWPCNGGFLAPRHADLAIDTDPNTAGDQTTLTFTFLNWNVPQNVTLKAKEDSDTDDSCGSFQLTTSGGDYENYGGQQINLRESDNDVAGRALTLSESDVTVDEGGTATYTVKLASQPNADVTVTVTRTSGDTDLTVDTDPNTTGDQDTLTFTATNYDTAQTVTVSAAEEDADFSNGSAVFAHTADGGWFTGALANLTATEADNDLVPGRELNLLEPNVRSASNVTVPEGGTAIYTVALAVAPGGPVTVAVTKKDGGDPDLTLVDTDPNAEGVQDTLTFTETDWNTPQTVTLRAAEDADRESGSAVFVHTATGGGYGEGADATVAEFTATEKENDLLVVDRALTLTPSRVAVPDGGTATYTVALTVAPYGPVTVTVTKQDGGDPDLTVDTDPNAEGVQDTLTFTETDWNTPQTVTLRAAEDDDREVGEAVFVHTATGGGYGEGADATVAELTATEDDKDILVAGRALTLTPSRVAVPERGTATYTVALTVAPYGPVTVAVALKPGGDPDLTAAPGSLTFTETDWNTPQTVTLRAAEDEDREDGEAVFVHTASGGGYGTGTRVTVAELTATENDSFGPKTRERLEQVNEAILPEILRAVVQHKIDNVVSRVVSGAVSEMIGTDEVLATAANLLARHGEALQEGVFSWREALAGSDIALALSGGNDGAGKDRGPGIAFWAMADYLHLSDDHPVEWEGGLFGAHVGSDAGIGRDLRAGVGLSWEEGSFDYVHRSGDGVEVAGTEDVRMTSVYPYVGWRLSGGSVLWATVGYGQGEVEFEDVVVGRQKGDLRQMMAAVGGTSRLAEAEGPLYGGEGTLDIKTQVSLGRLAVADNGSLISKTSVSAYGARVALEGSEAIGLAWGGTLTPSLEAGLRWDGGDGETGAGLELGGGLDYADPALGFSAGARGRALVAHASGLREWGVSGWLRLVPDSLGRGLSVEAAPSWGESASGVDDLWRRGVTGESEETRVEPPQARFDVEVGYGLAAPPDRRGLLTPYAGFGVTEGGSRSYRVGARFELGYEVLIDLEGRRDIDTAKAADHAIDLRITLNW